jgi:hypothetical protein
MIKCFIMLDVLKTILMQLQKDILEIWKLKKTHRVKHGEKDLTSRQVKLKHRELLMLEQQSTKKIQLHIEQLITRMDILPHMLT